jgi:glycolate oxidase
MPIEEWKNKENECLLELYEIVEKLGGKISGEHGIGIKRRKYMEKAANPVELDLMRSLKSAWDPNNIMNPGKIFL